MRLLLIFAVVFMFCNSNEAQVHVGVNINIGSQPVWGPVGYDYVEYYYFPDIDIFYYVPTHRFVCWEGGRWVFRASLPYRYRNYDLYSIHKEVINENRPYLRHEYYRDKFMNFRGRHDQQIIRNSHDSRYFVIKGHPEHDKWVREGHNDRVRGNNGNVRGNQKEFRSHGNDNGNRGRGNERGNNGNGKGNRGYGNDNGNRGHEKDNGNRGQGDDKEHGRK
jgi:hypothetical protein